MDPISTAPGAHEEPSRILVVCTGNICRSPMFAALLERRFASAGIAAVITSAGIAAADQPVDPGARAAMATRGAVVADAALIVTMERLHVREVVVLDPDAWPRSFTLKELVRRGEQASPRGPREGLDAWLTRMHAGRQIENLLGASPDDDIADPRGGAPEDYEQTAAELDDLAARLVRVVGRAR